MGLKATVTLAQQEYAGLLACSERLYCATTPLSVSTRMDRENEGAANTYMSIHTFTPRGRVCSTWLDQWRRSKRSKISLREALKASRAGSSAVGGGAPGGVRGPLEREGQCLQLLGQVGVWGHGPGSVLAGALPQGWCRGDPQGRLDRRRGPDLLRKARLCLGRDGGGYLCRIVGKESVEPDWQDTATIKTPATKAL